MTTFLLTLLLAAGADFGPNDVVDIQFAFKMADGAKQAMKNAPHTLEGMQAVSAKYGPSQETYDKVKAWVAASGMQVEPAEGTGRLFLRAHATVAQIHALLGVRIHRVSGQPPEVHSADGRARLPEWAQKVLVGVMGLDTRPRALGR